MSDEVKNELPDEGKKPKTTRLPKSKKPLTDKTEKASVAEAQIRLYHVFRVLSKLFHAEVEWDKKEFKDAGEAYSDLSAYTPFMSRLLRILSPFGLLAELYDKIDKLKKGMPPKDSQKQNVSFFSRFKKKKDEPTQETAQSMEHQDWMGR